LAAFAAAYVVFLASCQCSALATASFLGQPLMQ